MKRDLVLKLAEGEVAAALSNKFCQMANGAAYSDSGESHLIHDRKLDALEDLIEAANGKPVLVVIGSSTTWSGLPQARHLSFSKMGTSDSISMFPLLGTDFSGLNYSMQYTFRMHDRALTEVDAFLKVESQVD